MTGYGSDKKSPQKQRPDNYDYNIWSQNHPPPRESNGNGSFFFSFFFHLKKFALSQQTITNGKFFFCKLLLKKFLFGQQKSKFW